MKKKQKVKTQVNKGKLMLISTCVECDSKKSRFIENKKLAYYQGTWD